MEALNLGHPDAIYVNGAWGTSTGQDSIDIIEAATEDVIARVPSGTDDDVDAAVEAACGAFEDWAALDVAERASFLERLASELEACAEELAETITREVGTPISESRPKQVDAAIRTFTTAAALAPECMKPSYLDGSLVVPTPVGVVGCIVPWNYPLYLTATKVAPALASGCTVVVKPSQVAPLSIVALAAAADRAGLPPGVLNVVSGTGRVVGEALAAHPKVDVVSATGSPATGSRIAAVAGAALHRVSLELGGKSPSLVLADADLEAAVRSTLQKCFQNTGQTCAALTRLIVPRRLLDAAEEIARDAARSCVPGNPLEAGTRLGPVASAAQRDQVVSSIESGIAEGARLVAGGPRRPAAFERGYYVTATVFSDVEPEMTIAAEEIFGPVLSIQAYSDEAEGIAIANGTNYGLSAAVWSADECHALHVASAIRAGSISINGAPTHPDAPFGGFKHSGFGRERGRYGIDEYLTTQALHRPKR